MYKLYWNFADENGSAKHKVFKVTCQPQPTTPPSSGSSVPTTPVPSSSHGICCATSTHRNPPPTVVTDCFCSSSPVPGPLGAGASGPPANDVRSWSMLQKLAFAYLITMMLVGSGAFFVRRARRSVSA
jgi:hypothetical protein